MHCAPTSPRLRAHVRGRAARPEAGAPPAAVQAGPAFHMVCDLRPVFTFLKDRLKEKVCAKDHIGPQNLKYLLFGPAQKVWFIISKNWGNSGQRLKTTMPQTHGSR